MAASKDLNNYPVEFSEILSQVLEDGKTIQLTFPDVNKAKYHRLKWYGYRKAVANSQLKIASRAYALSISIKGATLILQDVNNTETAKDLQQALATAVILDN